MNMQNYDISVTFRPGNIKGIYATLYLDPATLKTRHYVIKTLANLIPSAGIHRRKRAICDRHVVQHPL